MGSVVPHCLQFFARPVRLPPAARDDRDAVKQPVQRALGARSLRGGAGFGGRERRAALVLLGMNDERINDAGL